MRRAGLTLIELIIVIAIVGVLIALLLPAVQYTRESARRLECSTRLRQIVLAAHSFESANGRLPTDSLFKEVRPYLESNGVPAEGDGHTHTEEIPHLGLRITNLRSVPFYRCPADPRAPAMIHRGFGGTSYCANEGTGQIWSGFNGAFQPEVPENPSPHNPKAPRGGPLTLGQITDGTSNTAAVCELLVGDGTDHLRRVMWSTRSAYYGPDDREAFCQACRGHAFQVLPGGQVFGSRWARGRPWMTCVYNHLLTPNEPTCLNHGDHLGAIKTAASFHPGGVNVAFLDGHVDFVSDNIDLGVWRAHGSRNGDEF